MNAAPALSIVCALGAVACASPPPATAPPSNRPPAASKRISAVCPDSVDPWRQWRRELFPGCPPPPFWLVGTTCDGDRCPRPCGSIGNQPGAPALVAERYAYDPAGRWTSTVRGAEVGRYGGDVQAAETPAGDRYCARTGDHAGTCDVDGGQGRRTELVLTFDDDGDVASIHEPHDELRGTTFEWSGHHLVTEHRSEPGGDETTVSYRYDARDRISTITSTGWGFHQATRYTYDDATDRPTRIATDVGDGSRLVTTFAYDDQGRPSRVSLDEETPGTEPARSGVTFYYECPAPRPFADAIEKMKTFDARACACRDQTCAEAVGAELDHWSKGVADLTSYGDIASPEQGAAFRTLDDETRACLGKLGVRLI